MDIPETVSVRKFREFTARQKQELYETLLELAETLEELPRKSLRKTLELTLAVLEYKGEQAAQLLEQGGSGGRLQGENEKLKRMLQRLEDERDGLKSKTKELGEEIRQLELRLREAAQQAEASDKDSSDPLSELDKQDTLLQNIDTKNKHIKRLLKEIEELNSLNEVLQENALLRRRLNIPEDVVVLAKNTRAKQRNKDKQIERLMLKLRTSEELRLQLKLEKSELRRKLLELNRGEPLVLDDVLRQVSEVGELPSSTPLEKSPRRGQGDGAASTEMQSRYDEVLAENETLRMGMYEILEKLREYDATSEHITIDSELLRRLIEALPSGISTPQRLQGQLLELKAREEALRQLLLQQNGSDSETGELSSVQSLCDVPEMPEEEHQEEHQEEHPKEQDEALPAINTATRPSTPTETTIGLQRPIITNMEEAPKSEQLLELSLLRKHYEELRLHMSADGNQLLNHNQQLHEQVLSLELQLEKNSSSYGYMRQEYDQLLTESRRQELRFIEDKSVLMRQQKQTQAELSAARDQLEDVHRRHLYTAEEHQQLEQRNAILCMQLGQATEQLLGELKLPDICAEYGIIGDNYQLDYVTAKEYEQQRQELASWRGKQAELQRETKQLEGLLSVANGQIHSQQKLLNDITDNHISLRHLVADLQSSSNEKLMLAKVQRDLDSVKAEVSRLEAEREQIQLKADGLQSQLEATERSMAQAQQDFQLELSNSEIKQKFLQHSLFALKEKYAKFTPLIFLTNFVFAYHKFQQRLVEHQQQQKADHSAAIREALELVQSKVTPQEDSSKQLIKLIKSETQSRLLEQRCESLQTKLEEVQRELSELRVRQSTDSEHWQTIHALFGEQGTGETTPCATVEAATNTGTADPATNTEAEVAPVPAMRRAAQLIDRQSSPIGSPRRRHPHSDTSTQTQEPVKLLETAVQTNAIRTQQHQAVQTSGGSRRGSRQDLQQMQASLLEANERCELLHHEPEGEQEKQDTEELKELPTLHKQIKELKEKLEHIKKSLKAKEVEVKKLKDKLKVVKKHEKALERKNPELDQLRGFIVEKDRHIKELLETMQNFHEDQQRYLKDSSHYSEEQMGKLSADLSRTKATNKIYHTQVEALRRQLTVITQREKQARELTQSLRQQLVKRPVVSIKTELNARVKNENQQKRIQQLEAELDDTRDQMQRQQKILETQRSRSANEVGLWEKQKRWQQQADKYKAKLEETEMALEKSRALLQAARTTIARLEKDKHLLETKVARGGPTSAPNNPLKCCRTPSCPNLQHVGVNKFSCSPSESPETYTGPSSECSSPAHHPQPQDNHDFYDRSKLDLIEALKNRIELQQRKIIAMELEGRGSNALTTELEKLQERFQGVEAQNIRMEARNLQLQLESDLLRQNDSTDRLQKRIKHLEDYIIALKEEMARNESRRELCKCSGLKVNTQQGQSAEHTILSLRNLVEKLRSENKFLKDGRRSSESRSSVDSSATPSDVAQWQQQHAESMQKISGLQQELQKRSKCSQCSGCSKDATNGELKFIKEQLTKKTELLEKAKILLTRAAAKEKVLREQLVMWKRKCSELANVPVIDEISE
ncbi:GL16844 [Drosophila persimilis]|uniref:GL16844 n=1 Tax=Drosophila persimilis TaxID=7234 RepID=B4HBN7_DROPE|nr:GL16844 [Drosophila persimilis]